MYKFRSIQVMRATAAMAVILFHLFPRYFLVGAAGVDIFFIISGFIMGTVGTGDVPERFFAKRIVRIVPLYWSITLLICILSFIPELFRRFKFDFYTLIKSLFFVPYFDQSGHAWPLIVGGWTLNYEMFFYIIFAVGLIFGRPTAISLATLMTLVVSGIMLSPRSAALQTWTNPLLLEFAAGLILAKSRFISGVTFGVVALLLGTVGFLFLSPSDGVGGLRLVAWGCPAFLLVGGAVAIERAGRWPVFKFAETIGDASYSLYLLHPVVIDFIHKIIAWNEIADVAIIVISLILGYLSWRYFEQPVGRYLGVHAKNVKLIPKRR